MIEFLHKITTNTSYFLGNFGQTIISLPKIMLQSRVGLSFPKPQKPKASILGNGPSLGFSLANDLDFIKNTELYCVNNFASSTFFTEIKPQNYSLLDPAYFLFNPENSTREDIRKTLAAFEKVNWQMNLFLPIYAQKTIFTSLVQKNNFIKIVFYNYTIVKGFESIRNWFYRHKLGMPQCQNILGASLYLAITRKHKEIYLFGADHSWHEELKLDNNNELTLKQLHFYDKPNSVETQKMPRIYLQFQSLAKAFFSYEVLDNYANYQDVKVFNASNKSFIDSFEKIKIELGKTHET